MLKLLESIGLIARLSAARENKAIEPNVIQLDVALIRTSVDAEMEARRSGKPGSPR
jgi:hypothetical protein